MTPSVEPITSVVSPRTTESFGMSRRRIPAQPPARVYTNHHQYTMTASSESPKTPRRMKTPDQKAMT